ncbi:MAG: transcription termination factor Rho [Lachnospiraceae bacterium]|nr:transcription termination factor Rho [Lachnospiraceae bacterium]
MREKYETLKINDLREIVKNMKVRGYSTMSKDELIDFLVEKEKESLAMGKDPVQSVTSETGAKETKVVRRGRDKKEVKEEASFSDKKETKEIGENKAKDNERSVKDNPDMINPHITEDTISEKASSMVTIGVPGFEQEYDSRLDSHNTVTGIVEIMPDGFGFIRSNNYLSGDSDVYIAPGQVRRFGLRTGDIVTGNTKIKNDKEKFSALLFITKINGFSPEYISKRCKFEDMTPVFPDEKIKLDIPGCPVSMRIVDLVSPVGKGQRGMIVSQPKAGKTTLLKDIAKSVLYNNKNMHMIILLIDERPEEVTDIKEAIKGDNVEVIYSTFDETPEHHKKVAEMVIERARRLVESKQDVIILLDSITRLTRAYNQVIPPSGRTLSGGLDPAALHMPKKFFGAARKMREGGSLTILATALVDTGSKMDDVVYEEFKGTGNMELVLDRKLSEKRVFPAIDIPKSGTRNEHLLLSEDELTAISSMRRGFNGLKPEEAVDKVIDLFSKTKNNTEFVAMMNKVKWY